MITTPLFEGVAQAWLRLYDQKQARDDEPNFLAPGGQSKHFQGDVFDAARACLGELGWAMDDSQSSRPSNRRHWDIPIMEILCRQANTEQGRLGLASFINHHSGKADRKWQFLGELMQDGGSILRSTRGIFGRSSSGKSTWYSCLLSALGATETQRKVHADFRVSATGIDAESSPGTWAVRWATKDRSQLTIRTTECAPDLSTQNQEFRAQQRTYAKRHGITYESVSDGTGLGTTAGFAWQITVDLRHPKKAMYREVGWAQGLSRSDTAELAGMVQQLRRAPDQAGVRLCSDCNGVLLMIERARTSRPQTVVRHAQRALLREWLHLESQRLHPVQLGWVRGHTTRTAIPYLAQQWCDAAAPKEANNVHDPRHISVHDGRFVLTDSQGYTVQGGWKAAVMAAGEALMDEQMGLDKNPHTRGEVLWHRLRHHFAPSEWDGLALIGKTSSAAALRFNAEADTITDPEGDRWRAEQAARDAGALADLQRSCTDCAAIYNGGWDSHKVRFCSSTRHLWASADLTLIQAWAQEVAWDFPDAWKLFRSHRLIWQQLAEGGTWLGFKLIERSVGSAPAATGLASQDADEEDVIAPSLVHAAAEKWASDHPELATTKKGGGAWEQLIPVLQSTRDPKLTLIPGKFFELLQQWQGPESDFESALISRLRVERRLHAQALSEGGYDDFWAWESWFIDARTKDIRKCQSRESRPFASYTHALRHLT